MLLKTLSRIPITQCLVHFPLEAHKSALRKLCVLWILTSLPIIVATFLLPLPDGNLSVELKLWRALKETIGASELFVYTATFLTPILYMVFDKYKDSSEEKFGEKFTQSVRRLFNGYLQIWLISIVIIVLTAVAFGQIKAKSIDFPQSFLGYYLINYSWPIYIFSLYCWYLTLLDETWSGNFVAANRESEVSVVNDFSARLRARKADDE